MVTLANNALRFALSIRLDAAITSRAQALLQQSVTPPPVYLGANASPQNLHARDGSGVYIGFGQQLSEQYFLAWRPTYGFWHATQKPVKMGDQALAARASNEHSREQYAECRVNRGLNSFLQLPQCAMATYRIGLIPAARSRCVYLQLLEQNRCNGRDVVNGL
jgi:hypothetical protein